MKKLWNAAKQGTVSFWRNEQGIGTLEIVLIIAVVVIIFLAFKDFIIEYVTDFIGRSETKLNKEFPKEP